MYSNFSALNTNMAIYLSPFQRHLTFSIHLTATLLYTWLRIFFREKITRSPLSPVPTKLLLSTEHNVEALILFVSPVVKKKKKSLAKSMLCQLFWSRLVCLHLRLLQGEPEKKNSLRGSFFSYRPSAGAHRPSAGAAPRSVLKVWNFLV